MDFKSRFKGKCTVMNKEGVIGIVKQQSNPVAKDIQKGYYTDYDYDQSPVYKKTQITEVPREVKSQVITNIQANKNSTPTPHYSQKFQNYAQQMLGVQESKIQSKGNEKEYKEKPYNSQKYTNMPIRFQKDFNELDMNEYEIVAIPRQALGQYSKINSGVDKYSMTHSFAPIRQENGYGKNQQSMDEVINNSLTKTYSHNPAQPNWQKEEAKTQQRPYILRPPLMKNQSERFGERKNKLQQAGLGTIRYNSYSKK